MFIMANNNACHSFSAAVSGRETPDERGIVTKANLIVGTTSNGATHTLPGKMPLSVTIYDVSGEKVREMRRGYTAPFLFCVYRVIILQISYNSITGWSSRRHR